MSIRVGSLALPLVVVLSPLIAACAHQGEHTESVEWQFDGTAYTETAVAVSGWPSSGARTSADRHIDGGNWSDKTYVYRGGQGPAAGPPYKQM